MDLFKKYVSNTLAACGNQTVFESNGEIQHGMIFLKVFKGGRYNYRFAFSAVIDSTFYDGKVSRCNDICPDWTIHSLQVAVTDKCNPDLVEKSEFFDVTFDGENSVIVKDKICFTDNIELCAEKDSYLCLEIAFSGKKLPCHAESIIPIYRKTDEKWEFSPFVPVPVFTGVERSVKKRVAFIGDSITQGIGSTFNSYRHYAARTAEILGDECAFWDLGLGFARGFDAATDGIWLEKAKQNDIICVCFGVNDILQGYTAQQLKDSIMTIIKRLKEAGVTVLIQTVPPFDYDEKNEAIWREVNDFIIEKAVPAADAFFDNRSVLCADGAESPKTKFGPHPNNEGHTLWGNALATVLKKLIEVDYE